MGVSKPSPNPSKYNWQQVAAERRFERTVLTSWKGRNILVERYAVFPNTILLPFQIQFRLLGRY